MLNPAQLSRIDVSLLVIFRTVLEEHHVARAADKLNLTPSAVRSCAPAAAATFPRSAVPQDADRREADGTCAGTCRSGCRASVAS